MAVAYDAVGPAGGAGFNFSTTVSPQTWTHVCGASATAIVIMVINGAANSNHVTAVTYGGQACALLGTQTNTGGSLVAFYGLLNPPTGSNTVSVTWTTGSGDQQLGGSISFTGAGSFGTTFGATNNGASSASQAVTVNGTTTGGMVASAVSYGGAGGTASWTFTAGGTVRWNDPFSNSAAGQTCAGGTVPSTGGGANQTLTWTPSAVSDTFGVLAVEVLPGTAPPVSSPVPHGGRYWRVHRKWRKRLTPVIADLVFRTAVTGTVLTNVGPGGVALRVWVITGQASSAVSALHGTFTTHASSQAIQATITTTVTGSRVYGAMEENNTSTTFTPLASTSMVDNVQDAGNAACYATLRAASLTGAPGATVFGTATAFTSGSVALAEVLPGTGLAEDASGPPGVSALAATTVATASFAPPPGALLLAAFCGEGDGVNVQTASMVDARGLAWTPVVFSCVAGSGFSGLWAATVPALGTGTPALPPGLVTPFPVPVSDGAVW